MRYPFLRMVRLSPAIAVAVALLHVFAAPMIGKRVMAAPGRMAPKQPNERSAQNQAEGQAPAAGSVPAVPEQGAHMDHKSKHGGAFFMSLDNKHHLEGVLLPPSTFRVYLYDDHTKPLKAEETKQANGTVQIGDSEDAPKIDLAPGKKKETLEAKLGDSVKFPVTLTLLLRLPGVAPDAKPEVFNFDFKQFTDERGPGTCTPMAKMPNMC